MRLTDHVTLVAGGAYGFDLSDPLDCHVYLVRGARHSVLVDAGAGRSAESIVRAVRATGADPGRLLLTHGHADHAGGAAALAERLPGLRVLAGAEATGWIAAGDEAGVSLDRGKASGYYPADYSFAPCPQVEALADGEEIDLGGGVVLRAVATPGHADGHLCFHLRAPGHRALFSGAEPARLPGSRVRGQSEQAGGARRGRAVPRPPRGLARAGRAPSGGRPRHPRPRAAAEEHDMTPRDSA
ncbi:MBL fold metallo-hydrolase [Streptomyces sp. MB09-02B]|uniref:MBL fold metallo-hydrolase n=1 Tax=Streptomyces sp. MB09-02B TaxID=3028667 RepID=UPI0029A49578|nr:MBL fold metallo-hydrolase [Streptomyces sp. MB09-02B]MDX3643438.1 MBL fold metallo-hydrolase [Streptomyces sp. MB09-02B]